MSGKRREKRTYLLTRGVGTSISQERGCRHIPHLTRTGQPSKTIVCLCSPEGCPPPCPQASEKQQSQQILKHFTQILQGATHTLLDATRDRLLTISCIRFYRSFIGAQPARHATLITSHTVARDEPGPRAILLDCTVYKQTNKKDPQLHRYLKHRWSSQWPRLSGT